MLPTHFHRPQYNASFSAIWVAAFACTALLGGLLFTSAAQGPQTGPESIRQGELEEKLRYFASPDFRGRGNGSPDLTRAAEYIAASFQKNGIRAAGNQGTYFQRFEMFSSRLGASNELRLDETDERQRTLRLGTDYVPYRLSPKGKIQAPMVFVGYGVVAPHLNFDEVSPANLKGKVAVAIDRNPRADREDAPFNKVHVGDFASINAKAKHVHNAGAVALIIIQDPQNQNSYSISQLSDMFGPDYPARVVPMGSMSNPDNPPLPVIILSAATGRELVEGLSNIQRRIDDTLQPQSMDLEGFRVTLEVDVNRMVFSTENVLGLIEGSDPQLRNEVLVIGAHYDHDGESNGQIWPGADDNASGTVALLELAEAYANGRNAPARSILLAAWAGEEKGLLGSQHYVTHPAIPLQRTIGMIQLDMIGRNEEHAENRFLGLERETSEANANTLNVIGSMFSSDLRRFIEDANRQTRLTILFRYDDTRENLIRRSDQWPFLQKGIPAIFFHTGEHPDYHTPRDTADKINYPKLEKIVRLVYLAAARIASAPSRPAFVEPAF